MCTKNLTAASRLKVGIMCDSPERLDLLFNQVKANYPEWIVMARELNQAFKDACISGANNKPDASIKLRMYYSLQKELMKLQKKRINPYIKSIGFKQPNFILGRLLSNLPSP
jgi:hypothetical protein